jgi:hypothetical protein
MDNLRGLLEEYYIEDEAVIREAQSCRGSHEKW